MSDRIPILNTRTGGLVYDVVVSVLRRAALRKQTATEQAEPRFLLVTPASTNLTAIVCCCHPAKQADTPLS